MMADILTMYKDSSNGKIYFDCYVKPEIRDEISAILLKYGRFSLDEVLKTMPPDTYYHLRQFPKEEKA